MALLTFDSIDYPVLAAGLLLIGFLYTIYRSILPRPLEGIPHNVAATKRIFGDLPEVRAYGSLTNWLATQAVKHQSPIFQAFIRPISKPWVVVTDYYEASEICTRRFKEFDRGSASTSVFKGVVPGSQITLQSHNPQFKKNKELVRNLMTPTFLSEVSAPEIYDKCSRLVDLWNLKLNFADGKFFAASRDIHHAALDIIVCASFGIDTQDTQLVKEKDQLSIEPSSENDGEISFKEVSLREELGALTILSESVAKVVRTPSPPFFHFLYRNLSSTMRNAIALTRKLQRREIANGIKRRQNGEAMKCALDEISVREEATAKKEGREPDYHSQAIASELMSYLIGGHETTSSTIRWGITYLNRNQRAQSELRKGLQEAYKQAKAEKRPPTLTEIIQTRVPYLDAVVDETLRVSYTFGMTLREAVVDTQLLGAHIPKGTAIAFLSNGPGVLSPPIQYDESRSSEWVRARKPKQPANQEYAFPDFVPERWLKSVVNEAGKEEVVFDSQAVPIQAFGQGPRGCFGKRLAYLEMKIFFTLIIWTFDLLPLPAHVATPKGVSSLTRHPDRVFIKPRRVVL
ncbi:unnamed protein product [Fusarium graminearum]|nr:hypothetical protein FG05_10629 [Fusarium graminearum]CAF3524350.1 unnamed protein product [Fusarium graminearum]CAG1973287.1 unnamed protein product [Fusarium graminearum]VTO90907.1 unnamed protein product [Fusarium graminearum]